MERFQLTGSYVKAVGRHWVWLVVAAVGVVGDGATLFGDFDVPRWIWWSIVAVGLFGAQFLAYADVSDALALARARLKDLDTPAAKRSYIEEAITKAGRLAQKIESTRDSGGWSDQTRRNLRHDIIHWESQVRADLGEWFPEGTDVLFDSTEGYVSTFDSISPDSDIEKHGWRTTRLRTIKATL